jgi:dienelactone hydrolase
MTTLSISPQDALLDQPVAIRVQGVQPGAHARLRLRNLSLKAEASAEFVAGADGVVDVESQAPIAGDYQGVEPAGLFWSARFDEGSDITTMIATLARLEPLAYAATVEIDGQAVTTTSFARRLVAPNVVQTPVRDGRLRGTLFAIDGATGAPGVIVLGGSDGGNLYTWVAAFLAAHGMAAMSLAYFGQEDLPRELIGIPVEYFVEAVAWLRQRPEVGGAGVGVLGFSRGGEAAFLTGATCPDVTAVVALVASGITGGGNGADFSAMGKSAWTLDGVPMPILPPPWDPVSMKEAQDAVAAGRPLAASPALVRALNAAGARLDEVSIRVERTRGPILMMSGEDDRLWAYGRLAQVAEERLKAHAFAFPFEHRLYAGAGHFSCLPPGLPATSNDARHPLVPMTLAFGGTARDNAAASADLWPRIVAFLHQHLAARPRSGPAAAAR